MAHLVTNLQQIVLTLFYISAILNKEKGLNPEGLNPKNTLKRYLTMLMKKKAGVITLNDETTKSSITNVANFGNIPDELKDYRNWVLWRMCTADRKGKKYDKPTKEPRLTVNPSAGASSTNSKHWNTYSNSVKQYKHICNHNEPEERETKEHGLGFVITNTPYIAIDLDHVLDGGAVETAARELAARLNTYCELSPSGKGLHLIGRGELPPKHKCKWHGHQVINEIEVYSTDRYITMTGNVLNGEVKPIADIQAVIKDMRAAYDEHYNDNDRRADERPTNHNCGNDLSIDEILTLARSAKNSEKFIKLFDNGDCSDWIKADGTPDYSRGDSALCELLAFWTNADPEKMQELFARSALTRDKWTNRQDYRTRTIQNGIEAMKKHNKDGGYTRPKQSTAEDDFVDLDELPDRIKDPQFPITECVRDKVRPIKEVWQNTKYVMDTLGIKARYNIMTNEVEFTGHDLEGYSMDGATTVIRGLMYINGLKIARGDLVDNIGMIAEQTKYSPVQNFLNEALMCYDGKDHIRRAFEHLHITPAYAHNKELYYNLFRKWLIGTANIAFNEGRDSMQGVLVLQGKQGLGKSRFLYALTPNPDWVAGGLGLDPAQKDDILKATVHWICELGELGDTLRKEKLDRLKAFLTAQSDDLRRPYGRTTEKLPRTTSFYGSVNGDSFLKDSTGERRYWCIPCDSISDMSDVDPLDLWGDVMEHRHERHWLTAAEIKALNEANNAWKKITEEEQKLIDLLDWESPVEKWTYATLTEISHLIEYRGERTRLIGKALQSISNTDDRINVEQLGHNAKRYLIPPLRAENPQEGDICP